MKKYTPISCDLYDQLEIAAMRNSVCKLEIGSQAEVRKTIEARIEDLFVREKVEYAKLSTGATIRLDELVRMNGIPFGASCDL